MNLGEIFSGGLKPITDLVGKFIKDPKDAMEFQKALAQIQVDGLKSARDRELGIVTNANSGWLNRNITSIIGLICISGFPALVIMGALGVVIEGSLYGIAGSVFGAVLGYYFNDTKAMDDIKKFTATKDKEVK